MKNGLLENIFEEICNDGVDLNRMNDDDLEKIKMLLNKKECILWINEHSKMRPYFVNEYGMKFYGFDTTDLRNKGFEFYNTFIHPDHFIDVQRTVAHFTQNPHSKLDIPYKVKNNKGDWCWTYTEAMPLNFTENGGAGYVLAIAFELSELFNQQIQNNNAVFITKNLTRYNSLTPREKEVLKLIGQEKTSKEIAEAMCIAPSTVDTHRKNMIHKLGVKSSLGLVKIYIMFNSESF